MPPLLEALCRHARTKYFPRGQIMLYQGDRPNEILVLKTGIVKLYDIDEQGNEKILHLLKPFGVLPLAFFSGGAPAIQWFYAALTDCEAYVLALSEMRKATEDNGALALLLTNWFSQEVHELLVRLSSMGKTNTRDKLVAALKFLATHLSIQRRSGWRRVNFPVNQQLLADMTGMTRESAAMTMKGLQDDQIVRHPRLTILEIDLDKLIKQG